MTRELRVICHKNPDHLSRFSGSSVTRFAPKPGSSVTDTGSSVTEMAGFTDLSMSAGQVIHKRACEAGKIS